MLKTWTSQEAASHRMVRSRASELRANSSPWGNRASALEHTAPVRIRDVASVTDGFKELRSYNRLDGKDNIFISVQKQSGTNTVRVADAVRQEINKVLQDYPNLDVIIASDNSDFVKKSNSG